MCRADTAAPGTTPPVESFTVPTNVATVWARAAPDAPRKTRRVMQANRRKDRALIVRLLPSRAEAVDTPSAGSCGNLGAIDSQSRPLPLHCCEFSYELA